MPRPVVAAVERTVIAAGARYTCALDAGRALCWGANENGQFGDGTRVHHASPVRVARTAL